MEENIKGEDDVPICIEYGNDWEDRFFVELGSSQVDSDQEDPEEEEEQSDLEPPPAKITWFQDAIFSLEAVQTFFR